MFIDHDALNHSTPFEGAERKLMNTRQVAFRPFERRRIFFALKSINMSPLRGEPKTDLLLETF